MGSGGMNIAVALSVGLLQGFLHCSGMCGPFVLAYAIAVVPARPVASSAATAVALAEPPYRWSTVVAHLCHNAGRIATFTVLGAAFGWIGSFVDAASRLTGLQAAAGLGGGALMIAWAVDQVRTGHGGSGVERWSLLRFRPLQRLFQRQMGRRDPAGAFLAGGILGFHPCGLLYTMLVIAAATGSSLQGALTMLAFGVGTVPALLSVAAAGTLGGRRVQGRLFSYGAAALVGASGILFALRGMAVNGWLPHVSPWLF
jgi:sulfite exporter TauE/SafE